MKKPVNLEDFLRAYLWYYGGSLKEAELAKTEFSVERKCKLIEKYNEYKIWKRGNK